MNELYQHLLEAYKKHRQTVAFDDKNAYEIYKWQLITATQGMSPIEIVRAHVNNPNKPEKGGFGNQRRHRGGRTCDRSGEDANVSGRHDTKNGSQRRGLFPGRHGKETKRRSGENRRNLA